MSSWRRLFTAASIAALDEEDLDYLFFHHDQSYNSGADAQPLNQNADA